MSKQLKKLLAMTILAFVPIVSEALPIDWHGSFGVDSTIISDYRRIKSNSDNSGSTGTQEVALDPGKKGSASWQSYILKLDPVMVINDAGTFFAELTTGYANGGFLGDSAQTDSTGVINGTSLSHYNQAKNQNLNIKKVYLEVYSDTATYLIGRHTYNWGLGALFSDGSNTWDRHASSHDGITMKLKIGNFNVTPYWSKVSNTGYTDTTNSKEYGTGFLYDNQERDISFGLLYGKKSASNNSLTVAGENDITITDIYLKKVFGKFDMAIEVPLMSGTLGKFTTGVSSYSAKALLLQTNYKHNDSWTFGFDAGQASGHDGNNGTFGALYLNPNYQVANLLFRYNLSAIAKEITDTNTASIYDSYITNTRYFKLRAGYASEKWTFDSALIKAIALKVAKTGSGAYNHATNKRFDANANQSNNLGTEIDLNADYHWNKEISIGTGLGYLVTGDYFGFTNTATPNSVKNSMLLQLNTSVTF